MQRGVHGGAQPLVGLGKLGVAREPRGRTSPSVGMPALDETSHLTKAMRQKAGLLRGKGKPLRLHPPLKRFVQSTGIGFQVSDQLSLHPLYLSFAFFLFLFSLSFLSLSFLFPSLPSLLLFHFVLLSSCTKEKRREGEREQEFLCRSRGKTFDICLYLNFGRHFSWDTGYLQQDQTE